MKVYVLVPETEMKKILANVNNPDLARNDFDHNLKNLNSNLSNNLFSNIIHGRKLMEHVSNNSQNSSSPQQTTPPNSLPSPSTSFPAKSPSPNTQAESNLNNIDHNNVSNNEKTNRSEVKEEENPSSTEDSFEKQDESIVRSSSSDSGNDFVDTITSPDSSISLEKKTQTFLGKNFHWLSKSNKNMANSLLNILVGSDAVKIEKGIITSLLSSHISDLKSFILPLYRKNGNIAPNEEFLNVISGFIPIELITNDKLKKIIKNGKSSGAGNARSGVKFFLKKWRTIL